MIPFIKTQGKEGGSVQVDGGRGQSEGPVHCSALPCLKLSNESKLCWCWLPLFISPLTSTQNIVTASKPAYCLGCWQKYFHFTSYSSINLLIAMRSARLFWTLNSKFSICISKWIKVDRIRKHIIYHLSSIQRKKDETFTISPSSRSETGHILNHCHFRIDLRIWNPDFGYHWPGRIIVLQVKSLQTVMQQWILQCPRSCRGSQPPSFHQTQTIRKTRFQYWALPNSAYRWPQSFAKRSLNISW